MSSTYSEIAFSRSCAMPGHVRLVADKGVNTKKREAMLPQLFRVLMGVA